MKQWTMAVLLGALPLAASAQDPAKVDPGHYKVLIDNASVRVLKVSVGAGEKSPMHAHPDAILVPLASGKVRFAMADGTSVDRDLTNEVASFTPAGTHAPTNVGTTKVDAILVEFKAAAAGTATLPAAREGLALTVLAECPRGTAWRSTTAPNFTEAAGATHEFDQVVVALAPSALNIKVEGQSARTSWQRGDVIFIGRGVKHETKNTGGKPSDFIVVGIR